jgi:hypothetical protein
VTAVGAGDSVTTEVSAGALGDRQELSIVAVEQPAIAIAHAMVTTRGLVHMAWVLSDDRIATNAPHAAVRLGVLIE